MDYQSQQVVYFSTVYRKNNRIPCKILLLNNLCRTIQSYHRLTIKKTRKIVKIFVILKLRVRNENAYMLTPEKLF